MSKRKSTMESLSLKANESVLGTLSPLASEGELRDLGTEGIRVIRTELRKASLDNLDQVEDILQEALLNTLNFIVRQGPKRIRNIRSLFLTVSRNEARRCMRESIRKQRTDQLASEWLRTLGGDIQLPREPLKGERRLVLEALSQLSERSRLVIELMFIESKNNEEMESALSITPGALRAAKSRALKELRDALKSNLAGLVRSRMTKPATAAEKGLWEELKAELDNKS